MQVLPEALRPLADYSQFILWEAVWDAAKNKYQKITVCPLTRVKVDAHDPRYWMDFSTAMGLATAQGLGVGFVLSERDPFFCVDLDNALQPDGSWSPLANELCQAFGGAAVEVSYSGKGLHIFGTGQYPVEHRNRRDELGLEFYSKYRFMALGCVANGLPVHGNAYQDCTPGINYLLTTYFPDRVAYGSEAWTTEPVAEWDGPADDDELIKKMLAAKPSAAAAFGGRASVKELWLAEPDTMAKYFPSVSGDVYNRSSADAALMQHLAFWCGKNCERMERIFERSGLMRQKWTDRPDYRVDTTTSAASWCKDVYKMRRKVDKPEPAPYGTGADVPDGAIRDGFQYLGLPQQFEFFRGCVYVSAQHAIKVPDGRLLSPDRFKTEYGGYMFAMDSIGDKSSKNAWEVFTESMGAKFPKVRNICFRPLLPANEIIEFEGDRLVNVYVPPVIEAVYGDPSLFLDHLARILPDPNDRAILVAYMAACVQFKGEKFRWCPLIQGVPGNGKTVISLVVANAIGGRYCHSPSAGDIASKFNDWIENKLLIYVNDIYTADRQEVTEFLKPIISERRVEVHPKGGAKYMADNCANFILNSNHKDGLRKTADDRRVAPFFTAQQTRADLARDGLGSRYFTQLFSWLDNGGFAILTHYLMTYPIAAELDPRHMSEAPTTSSSLAAIEAGLGVVEQEIIEAIAQGEQGFAGGWVSSMALERLLENKNLTRRIPQNKRRDLMESLGYIRHPGLPDGRVTTVVAVDGGSARPRLYIKAGHLAGNLQGNKAIVDAYTKAQEQTATDITQQIFNKG